jgi:hypothetical protein
MVGLYVNHNLADDARRGLVFSGNLLLQSPNPATVALADHAISMISEALAPYDPQRAQFEIPVEEFVRRVGPLKSRFTNDLRTKEIVRNVLQSFGCDLQDTYFDVPRLRVVPDGGYLSAGVSYAYKAHRDIWYSSPTSQVNWWMPVFPVTPERAMSFFPEYWERPLKNSSAQFDYAEWCAVARSMAASQIKQDTRNHPLPLEAVSTTSEVRISGTKGDMIFFSAAAMHATAPNSSGLTRFSIDFRTINVSDIRHSRGAPNIDCEAVGTTLGDFLRGSDFSQWDLAVKGASHVA